MKYDNFDDCSERDISFFKKQMGNLIPPCFGPVSEDEWRDMQWGWLEMIFHPDVDVIRQHREMWVHDTAKFYREYSEIGHFMHLFRLLIEKLHREDSWDVGCGEFINFRECQRSPAASIFAFQKRWEMLCAQFQFTDRPWPFPNLYESMTPEQKAKRRERWLQDVPNAHEPTEKELAKERAAAEKQQRPLNYWELSNIGLEYDPYSGHIISVPEGSVLLPDGQWLLPEPPPCEPEVCLGANGEMLEPFSPEWEEAMRGRYLNWGNERIPDEPYEWGTNRIDDSFDIHVTWYFIPKEHWHDKTMSPTCRSPHDHIADIRGFSRRHKKGVDVKYSEKMYPMMLERILEFVLRTDRVKRCITRTEMNTKIGNLFVSLWAAFEEEGSPYDPEFGWIYETPEEIDALIGLLTKIERRAKAMYEGENQSRLILLLRLRIQLEMSTLHRRLKQAKQSEEAVYLSVW